MTWFRMQLRNESDMSGSSHGKTTVEQRALWYIQTLEPTCAAYNSAMALELHFSVEIPLLKKAVRSAVADHEILRSAFRSNSLGEIYRCRLDQPSELPCLEVSSSTLRGDELYNLVSAVSKRPFKLDRESPFRAVLFPGKPDADVLLIVVHHIVADGYSHILIAEEILQRYASLAQFGQIRQGAARPEPKGIAERQQTYLASARAQEDRAHWRRELAGLSSYLELPIDLPQPPTYQYEGAEVPLELGLDLLDMIDGAATAAGVTTFTYLLAVYQVLLYKLSSQRDFVLGYTVSSRRGTLGRDAIGFFSSVLPLRSRIDPGHGFEEVLQETWTRLRRGIKHRAYPHALLPWPAELTRDIRRPGPVTASFAYTDFAESGPLATVLAPGRRVEISGLAVSSPGMPHQHGQFEIVWDLYRGPTFAQGQLKYNTSLFTQETAQRFSQEYTALLHAALAGNLSTPLAELPSVRPASSECQTMPA